MTELTYAELKAAIDEIVVTDRPSSARIACANAMATLALADRVDAMVTQLTRIADVQEGA